MTWQLWTPTDAFPQVPLFVWWLPAAADWFFLAIAIAALIASTLGPRQWAKVSLAIAATAITLLILQNQHRAQPWAYQFVLTAIVWCCCPGERAFRLLGWLTISIYFYSGVAKLDYTFLHSLGPQFLEALLNLVGASSTAWPAGLRTASALVFPLTEIAVAIGLAIPESRRFALALSYVMHVGLILCLGPWALDHAWGVLLWNVFFMVQNWLLFSHRLEDTQATEILPSKIRGSDGSSGVCRFATAVLMLALILPIAEWFHRFDHWPAWALYAPRAERIAVFVPVRLAKELPAELQPYLRQPVGDSDLVELRLDRWSIAALGAPIYPQNRFQVAVVLALAERMNWDQGLGVLETSVADRRMGQRMQRWLAGRAAIRNAADEYWLNTTPR